MYEDKIDFPKCDEIIFEIHLIIDDNAPIESIVSLVKVADSVIRRSNINWLTHEVAIALLKGLKEGNEEIRMQ